MSVIETDSRPPKQRREVSAREGLLKLQEAGIRPILVPISQASALIGKCHRAVYQLIAAGKIKAVKDGRSTLVVYESLMQHAATLPPAKIRMYVPKQEGAAA